MKEILLGTIYGCELIARGENIDKELGEVIVKYMKGLEEENRELRKSPFQKWFEKSFGT